MQSKACNLNGMPPKQLVDHGEHENEWGGCFVMKGHEKLIRMLLMTRKNFPITVSRNTWRDRGQNFSDLGIMVRSVRTDQTATVSKNYNKKCIFRTDVRS
jgi:DNA-directed RNA polymerase I subunit RPA2